MLVGGQYLASGTELNIADGDYRDSDGDIQFFLYWVVPPTSSEWVTIVGLEKAPNGPWTPRHLDLRVDAVRRSLIQRSG